MLFPSATQNTVSVTHTYLLSISLSYVVVAVEMDSLWGFPMSRTRAMMPQFIYFQDWRSELIRKVAVKPSVPLWHVLTHFHFSSLYEKNMLRLLSLSTHFFFTFYQVTSKRRNCWVQSNLWELRQLLNLWTRILIGPWLLEGQIDHFSTSAIFLWFSQVCWWGLQIIF